MPVSVAKWIDRKIVLFIAGMKRMEWAPRKAIHAGKSEGRLNIPYLNDWAKAIWTSTRTKIIRRGNLWTLFLADELDEPAGFLHGHQSPTGTSSDPSTVLAARRAPIEARFLTDRCRWLLPITDSEFLQAIPLKTPPFVIALCSKLGGACSFARPH